MQPDSDALLLLLLLLLLLGPGGCISSSPPGFFAACCDGHPIFYWRSGQNPTDRRLIARAVAPPPGWWRPPTAGYRHSKQLDYVSDPIRGVLGSPRNPPISNNIFKISHGGGSRGSLHSPRVSDTQQPRSRSHAIQTREQPARGCSARLPAAPCALSRRLDRVCA